MPVSSPPEPQPKGPEPSRNGDAANRIVQKLWSYCHVLRDDGLSYQDYLEQLTFLLFLKMADERARLTDSPFPRAIAGPTSPRRRWKAWSWSSTIAKRSASWASRAACSA
jgi:hypothetical protein